MEDFSDIVHAIYDAALAPEKWPAALSRIGARFGAEGAVIIFYSGTSQADFIFSREMREAVKVYLDEEWWQHDIHAQRALEGHLTTGDVFSDFTIATREEIDTLPIYVDFFRRVGFGWLMSTVMLPDLDMLVALSIPRAKHKGAYQKAEMAALRILGRHVEQSLRISLRIENLETAQSLLLTAIDTMEAGIYALDGEGRPVLVNKAGRAQFSHHFMLDDGRLVARSAQERPRLAALLADALASGQGRSAPQCCVLEGADGTRLAAWALPVTPGGHERIEMTGTACTLVLAMPVQRDRMVDPTILRDIFDLSLGEARLAALIGGGVPVREAAGRLGVTEGTARIVLKRVFRKLGINRQAELVLQLSAIGGVHLPDGTVEDPAAVTQPCRSIR